MHLHRWNRLLVQEVAWNGLELDEGKLSRPVLRGRKGSNALSYPLASAAVRYQQWFRRTGFCWAFGCNLVLYFFNRLQFRGLTSNEFPAFENTQRCASCLCVVLNWNIYIFSQQFLDNGFVPLKSEEIKENISRYWDWQTNQFNWKYRLRRHIWYWYFSTFQQGQ